MRSGRARVQCLSRRVWAFRAFVKGWKSDNISSFDYHPSLTHEVNHVTCCRQASAPGLYLQRNESNLTVTQLCTSQWCKMKTIKESLKSQFTSLLLTVNATEYIFTSFFFFFFLNHKKSEKRAATCLVAAFLNFFFGFSFHTSRNTEGSDYRETSWESSLWELCDGRNMQYGHNVAILSFFFSLSLRLVLPHCEASCRKQNWNNIFCFWVLSHINQKEAMRVRRK